LTISNQIAPAPGLHPVEVDRRKLKRTNLYHLSWAEIVTIAIQQRVHRGVADPDQAWILGELIRYLEHPRSGAVDFTDMGPSWVTIRESAIAGTLRLNDKGLSDIVSRWEQLMRFAALRLSRSLGATVEVTLSRKEAADPAMRLTGQAQSLVHNGTLTASLRVPRSIAALQLAAELRSRRVAVWVDVDAPREGRPTTRVNWLLRQLRDAPANLRIDAFALNSKGSTSGLLGAVRAKPEMLVDNAQRELRSFRVTSTSTLGAKRGTGRDSFIDSVLTTIDGFYETVVQTLRPWTARAPQLPQAGRSPEKAAGLDVSPPSQDLADNEVVGPPAQPPVDIIELDVAASNLVAETESHADEPLISWDNAQDRLDHERDLTQSQGAT
jgi:hypothetical protein